MITATLQPLLDDLSEALLVLDSAWTVICANAAAASLSRAGETLLGADLRERLRLLPDSVVARALERSMRERVPVEFDYLDADLGLRLRCRARPLEGGLAVVLRDVTRERQQVERFQLAEQSSLVGLWDVNLVSGTSWWSPGCFAIYGRDPASFRPSFENWLSCIHEDDRADAEGCVSKAIESRSLVYHDFRIRHPRLGIRWVLENGLAFFDAAGRATRVAGVVLDITDRRNAQEQLQRTLESMSDAFVSLDREGRFTYINARAGQLLEREPGELLGRVAGELFPSLHATAFGYACRRALAEQAPRVLELPTAVRDHLLQARIVPSQEGLSIFLTDLTELRRAEAHRQRAEAAADVYRKRLHDVVASLPAVVWETSSEPGTPASRPSFVSDGVTRMLGYDVDEWLATPDFWLAIVHPDDRERALSEAVALYRAGRGGISRFRWVARDGQVLWVEARSHVMTALDGTPIGTRGVTVDISDRMRLESERQDLLVSERDARQQAEEVNRVKDEFLMTLSHELRTPLNAIYGWARLLRQSHPDEAMLERGLAIIERNAEIQTQLVSDLLDVSRVITGKLRLDLRECDPVVAVNGAVDAIRPSADAKRITLTTIVPTSPVSMLVDPERLQQVVWNLLANAVKFTPREGSVRIEVERRGASLEIEVIDTGEGIAPEALPFIFERFRQGRTGTTRTHAGLGLGLSIARHFVELHGGSVTATSSGEGCGSTFRVVLPVAARPPRVVGPLPLAPMVPSAITASSSGARLDGVTVLVVDDQEDGRELLALVLKRAGADVQTAASSAEAMALLTLWHPEILVLDIEMPREDGYALLGRVRAFEHVRGRRQSTAVAVTAHARQEDRARALAVGFDLHLAKPIDPTELIALIAARRERQIEHERANTPTIDPAQPG